MYPNATYYSMNYHDNLLANTASYFFFCETKDTQFEIILGRYGSNQFI